MDFTIKSLDHLGIVSGVMQDLKLASLADKRLVQDAQVGVTAGEALVAMILNGLGFSNRVISLTPQFFTNKPLDLLIRPGITDKQLNRHKLGRTLDLIADYGCEKFFNEIALVVCVAEKIDLRKMQGDTTTFSVEGAYDGQDEDAEVHITHGYSKAKRPDLKQIILELCVSPDGSVPFIMKPWSGNKADNKIFNARVKALSKAAADSHTGRTLIADAKLYTKENIHELSKTYFVTRVPASIKLEGDYITMSLKNGVWEPIGDGKAYKFQSFDLEHYGMQMRWIVFYSQQAHDRAKKSLEKIQKKEAAQLEKDLFHLQAQRFSCGDDAKKALAEIAKKYSYQLVNESQLTFTEHYETAGRPASGAKKTRSSWQITASVSVAQTAINNELDHRSCFILATNIPETQLASADVLKEYKGQDHVEKSFAFMKTPNFFASTFYLKSVARIQALLVIMTLALLVYTIAQRRLRQWLTAHKKTIPNQINISVARPTLRWAFQCLEGIYQFTLFATAGPIQPILHGLTDLKKLILSCFGETVMKLYGIYQPQGSIP